jgi:hypothetical protein
MTKENWTVAALDAVTLAANSVSKLFTKKQLDKNFLPHIVKVTQSIGKTPRNTLAHNLQILRDMGLIIFVRDGVYKLTDTKIDLRKMKKEYRSKGEIMVKNILDKLHIDYDHEKKFEDMIYKGHLRFDFYFEYNKRKYAIEFDGIQHFRAVDFFGGEKALIKTQKRDKVKNKYCEKNDIIMIRIRELSTIEAEKNIKKVIKK